MQFDQYLEKLMEYHIRRQEWIRNIVAGKNISKENINLDSNIKVEREDSSKNNNYMAMTWSELIRQAEQVKNLPEQLNNMDSLDDLLLNSALNKSARIMSGRTGLDVRTTCKVMLDEWKKDDRARRTHCNSVRFFRDFPEEIFTECEECGEEMDVEKTECSNKQCLATRTRW